jgi:hypothetical protein
MKETLRQPSFRAALRFWFKLGWISFGGTAAHIACPPQILRIALKTEEILLEVSCLTQRPSSRKMR